MTTGYNFEPLLWGMEIFSEGTVLAASERKALDRTASEHGGAELSPEDWVDAYGDDLYRFAKSRLRETTAAEEVVQETFLAGIRYASQFQGGGSQGAWLRGILRRKIIDHMRQHQRETRNIEDDALDPTALLFDEDGQWKGANLPTVPPDDFVESNEIWQVVRDCLTTIPQAQADVFVLSVMENMDYHQICEELSITPGNLFVRLHRARLGLAKCVSTKWFLESKG